jgi:hypothetical protein
VSERARRGCVPRPDLARPDRGAVRRYCPGGPDSDFDYSTQSYTGYEPTSMRAIRARYDPYEQTRGRVDQLRALGHNVDKVRHAAAFGQTGCLRVQVEFIIMGGTFMSMPQEYREAFVAQLHNALSGFTGTDVDEAVRCVRCIRVCSRLNFTRAGTLSGASPKLLGSRSRRGRTTASSRT